MVGDSKTFLMVSLALQFCANRGSLNHATAFTSSTSKNSVKKFIQNSYFLTKSRKVHHGFTSWNRFERNAKGFTAFGFDLIVRGGSQNNVSELSLVATGHVKSSSGLEDTLETHTPSITQELESQSEYSTIVGNLKEETFGDLDYLSTQDVARSGQHRVIFILGGPGSGKGTQCELIVEQYKCLHLSVGDLLRKEREKEGSEHAKLIEETLIAGKIVPVELSLGLLTEAMDEAANKSETLGAPIFLVDGFPRNFDNIDGWIRLMPEKSCVFGSLVYDCPIKELERRILSRGETSGRSDDNIESARRRFRTYEKETVPVVNLLDKKGGSSRVIRISSDRPIEKVWNETELALNSFILNDILTANHQLLESITKLDIPQYLALVDEDMLPASCRGEQSNLRNLSDMQKRLLVFSLECNKASLERGNSCAKTENISNVSVKFSGGVNAVVSYDRSMSDEDKTELFRETRVWQHQKKGWVNIHFVRSTIPALAQPTD